MYNNNKVGVKSRQYARCLVKAIINATIVMKDYLIPNGTILIDGDTIREFGKGKEIALPDGCEIIDAEHLYVGPGLIDIHTHAVDNKWIFEEPEACAKHLLLHGVTGVLPALYNNLNKQDYLQAIDNICSAKERGAFENFVGFYMEGPYLSPKYGASAAFNQWAGEIKESDYKEVVDKAGKDVKVWVVAPEREGIEPFMAYAKQVNPSVRFSVGHSEANFEEIENVKKYGVCLLTHCMNATGRVSSWKGTRACGPDEACFLDDDMYAELICDSLGVHVNPDLQRLIIKIKGWDKLILISDSFVSDYAPQKGLEHVTDVSFDENGDLSGSKLTMNVACRNLIKHTGCSMVQAFWAASRNPARVLGLDGEIGTIEKGKKANLVFVDSDLNVEKVMLNGRFIK